MLESDVHALPRGGRHVHIPIRFEDGVEWFVRKDNAPFDRRLPEIDQLYLGSEVATLRWLRTSGFPVPEVHGEPYRKLPLHSCPISF